MKTIDFDYELPQELIAQTPLQDRASSKLLVVDRVTGMLEDRHFYDVLEYLNEGDCLVVNDSKVLPARIYGIKRETQAKIEFLLVKQLGTDRWRVMAKPAKRLKIGTIVDFDEKLTATVINKREDGLLEVQFQSEGSLFEAFHRIGTMPLPPYIKTKLKDQSRYQTIYANKEGSSAAPTAGLHFTEELLHEIEEKGVKIAKITLHVGLGTFLPVSEDEITEHKMHSEYYEISQDDADLINRAKKERHRVIAVGTTSVRTLESCAERNDGKITAETRETDIFIYPGFQFRVVDHLITNFHLPKSTLLMLISAFYDREKILEVYRYAVQQQYRFFSFGDAMLIL